MKPDRESCQNAARMCEDLAEYYIETSPHATHDISVLEEAATILSAFAEYGEDEDEDTDSED